ncbi:hypothetical protein BH11MYX1_BH11MYX1_27130 [soil metagenome]
MKRFILITILAACGSSSTGDDGTTVDGNVTPMIDADACAGLSKSAVAAATACGSPLPASAQASLEQWCRKGVTRVGACGGDPAGGLACFASPDASDWTCALGQPYPSCGGDTASALGAYCLIASGNPACESGIACAYDVDCSGSSACNTVTKQCFSKAAYCIGLPCAYDVDCPSSEKCNSAEHACVAN